MSALGAPSALHEQHINGVHEEELEKELPTHHRLGGAHPKDTDARQVAEQWVSSLNSAKTGKDFADLFLEDGWWRDRLTFTWDFRSLHGRNKIAKAFDALKDRTQARDFKLDASVEPILLEPFEGLSYVQAHFTFDAKLTSNEGVANLVYTNGAWKGWTVLTFAEELKSHPSAALRPERKVQYNDFKDEEPPVLIIGGGHSGMSVAAQLDNIGVRNVVIERNERIGDQWRQRYDALSLHSLAAGDSLPFLPFPKLWPSFPQRNKVANFLEFYADVMHLNIWTSTHVDSAKYDKAKDAWTVELTGPSGKRTLHPKRVVLATGLSGHHAYLPDEVPGQKEWKGQIIHSTQYKNPKPYAGKKVVVVGTASTGFDIAGDLGRAGVDTTMLERSPTYIMSQTNGIPLLGGSIFNDQQPLKVADKLSNALPIDVMKLLTKPVVKMVAELDKKMLDGLEKAGFQTSLGQDDLGHLAQGLDLRSGGYFFDTGLPDGSCQQIIDGIIKIEQGSIVKFEGDEVVYSTGRRQKADAVVFCTGFTKTKSTVESIFGNEVAEAVENCWGLDKEAEVMNNWRPSSYPGFYACLAGFIQVRFNSQMLARLIAADLDGNNDIKPYQS